MSEAPELSETEAFAAEHALGVLSALERRSAETRMAADPAFAALVETHVMTLARVASNRSALRQTVTKTSCKTSSASSRSERIRRQTPKSFAEVAS